MTSTSSWQDTYLQALQDRNAREQGSSHKLDTEFITAYTALLDQVAYLKAQLALQPGDPTEAKATASAPSKGNTKRSTAVAARELSPALASPPQESASEKQLRLELAEALRSNTQLSNRLKVAEAEVTQLRARTKADAKSNESLKRGNNVLERKIKDMIDELKGKTRGYGDVQDEMISLNLQLNMAEQKAKRLAAENQELIDRWMKRKELEVEAMNQRLQ